MWWVEHGDSASLLKLIPDGSVDALVTDPPAGISFMGKEWDGAKGGRDKWITWLASILQECRRCMKPGAYGWVWALPRTSHWTATACEDAGFAVRDVLGHVFGTGFPKSRALLKPAMEHWILIKAPGELRELRIDENRIEGAPRLPGFTKPHVRTNSILGKDLSEDQYDADPPSGRWPANFALSHTDDCELVGTRKMKGDNRSPQDGKRDGGFVDVGADKGDGKPCGPLYGDSEVEEWRCTNDCPVRMLDEQSVKLKAGEHPAKRNAKNGDVMQTGLGANEGKPRLVLDSGGASRFYYVAKPSSRERSAGLGDDKNTHTTVKSIALMRHLVSLIAAPGALILDPFAGSGTTGVAAVKQGCRFVGIEREVEYVDIARRRIAAATIEAAQ